MTPYTDEQRADLAKRIEARSKVFDELALFAEDDRNPLAFQIHDMTATTLRDIAAEIRDGSFFEVQHD